jgi:alpha-amylase/alpha-mannosidase (GH57 family)
MSVAPGTRYVCVHGHFYQPPRENPWLEVVEEQEGAAPYRDWNARIAAECYGPNTRARVLDSRGRIVRLANNFARISFNVGPTLMSWLELEAPETYEFIRSADREAARRWGHGSAIAQAYGHAILPLLTARDRLTQVHWGIRDFEHRFGRRPAGMWLPETAVDSATLRVLAEEGVRFTILAPHQAVRLRRAGSGAWETLAPGSIDTRRPYRWRTGGAEIVLFFYDGALAHAVAFGDLLKDGVAFARRIRDGFEQQAGAQLVHLATDGESYGHHHRFGEMALAYALDRLDEDPGIALTNYGGFLEATATVPLDEVEIVENSSWSCAHGIERWRGDCGCNTGAHPAWRQDWRRPLRDALDWLRVEIDRLFEDEASSLLKEPWKAREDYIDVLLQPHPDVRKDFLAQQGDRALAPKETARVWKLLEMQRAGLLMFTSCGWFFDDLAGIETTQVMRYACRAARLAAELGRPLEDGLLARLDAAEGNGDGRPSGRRIYAHEVAPAAVSLPRAVAHAGLMSLFAEDGSVPARAYCYRFEVTDRACHQAGDARLEIAVVQVVSERTQEAATYAYALLASGGQDAHCTVTDLAAIAGLPEIRSQLAERFRLGPMPSLTRAIESSFGADAFSLSDLFQPQRRELRRRIGTQAMAACASAAGRVLDRYERALSALEDTDEVMPKKLRTAAALVLQPRLEAALLQVGQDENGAQRAETLLQEARGWRELDRESLQAVLEQRLDDVCARLAHAPAWCVSQVECLLELASALDVTLNLWMAQNRFYDFAMAAPLRDLAPADLRGLRRLGVRLGFAFHESAGRPASAVA